MTDSEWAALRQRMVNLAASRYGPEYAEDIVQEALRRFFSADRQHVGNLPGYLMKAIVHQGASDWRCAVRRGQTVEKCGRELITRNGHSPVDIVDGRAQLGVVTEMIGSAGVDIMLSYSEDGAEITAGRLGISRGYMRVLVFSVRVILRGDGNRVDRWRLRRFRGLAERVAA